MKEAMHVSAIRYSPESPPKGSNGSANQRVAFIIKGPPTYLAAEEAQYQEGLSPDQCILFVVLPALEAFKRTERLEAVIEPSRWAEVCWLRIESKSKYEKSEDGEIKEIRRRFFDKLFKHRADAKKAKQIAREWGHFQTVYGVDGAFYEHLACSLKPEKLILLEAGISLLSRVGKGGFINYLERAGKRERLILALCGFKIFDRKRTALFTNYTGIIETKHRTIANTNLLKNEQCRSQPQGSHVLWIGAPFCEYFGVPEVSYFTYIAESLKSLDIDGQDVTYVAHPGKEDAARLNRLSKVLNCRIDDQVIPVEVKVARGRSLPRAILSATSSSLPNLARMLPEEVAIISAWHHQFNAIGNLMRWRRSLDTSAARRIQFLSVGKDSNLFAFNVNTLSGKILYDSLTQYAKESTAGMFHSAPMNDVADRQQHSSEREPAIPSDPSS